MLRGDLEGIQDRVGVLPSLVTDTLPIVLKNILHKLPGIQLQCLEAPNHRLIMALLHGEIDFAHRGDLAGAFLKKRLSSAR